MSVQSLEWIDDLSLDELRFVVGAAAELLSGELACVEDLGSYLDSRGDDTVPLTWTLGKELKAALFKLCTSRPELGEELCQRFKERRANVDEIVVSDIALTATIVIGVADIVATFVAAKIFASPSSVSLHEVDRGLVKSLIDRIESLEKTLGTLSGAEFAPTGTSGASEPTKKVTPT